ncbi:CheY-like chemotaxis protein [Rhizomicrobium palustre]|uniref:CheY-like chemotaxis protein n=1 Tax=Rhizomicrobium palustre TaxID=189966 RepID=A0A846MXB1_9PROT|nr:response regulator [Rhizomicrobium palustre]NIK87781.1 CheY-like chemotaxis protein [Rhizomicrobium palustre]
MAVSLKALVVEDNMHMRVLLRTLLRSIGISEILEATNGDSAIQMLAETKVDLILTDLSMEPLDGIAFTRAVREAGTSINPYIPIIMVTGHTERHRVEAARDAGVTEFVAKPLTAKNLFARITEVVERPRAYVRCDDYFGPDRRRRANEQHQGPWRREDDVDTIVVGGI